MKNDRRRGSVTIEAAIALVITISAMLTLNAFLKVTYVHSVVQHALIQVGNEMATYDYILSLLGFSEINKTLMGNTMGEAERAKKLANEASGKIDTFKDVMEDLTSQKDNDGKIVTDQTGEEIKNLLDAEELKSCIVNEDGEVDFMGLFDSFIRGALGEATSEAKTAVLNLVTKSLLKTYIQNYTKSDGTVIDDLEKNLVPGGVGSIGWQGSILVGADDGLDFSASTYFDYPDTDTIELSCSYVVKVVSPIPIIQYVPMVNTVKVRAWQDEWTAVALQQQAGSSVWTDPEIAGTTKIYDAIMEHEVPEDQRNMKKNGTFIKYLESSKTAIKATTVNFMTEGAHPDNGRSMLTQDISAIRNFSQQKNTDGKTIKSSDIKTVKYYVYIPSSSAVMTTDKGKELTAKQNELANKQSKGGDSETIKNLQSEINSLKKEVNEEKKKLAEKTAELKKIAAELESNFNGEGNEFKLDIEVKAVDYAS